MTNYINPIVIQEIHNFITEHFNDKTLADYILSVFSIDKKEILSARISYETFYNLLSYVQKMTGNNTICFEAGMYFTRKRLYKNISIGGLRFSLRRVLYSFDKIIQKNFPEMYIHMDRQGKKHIRVTARQTDRESAINYYFCQFLKGIATAVPRHWNLPKADVTISQYPFSIDELLKVLDVPFESREGSFYIHNRPIAKKDKKYGTVADQVITDDLYIRDILLEKNTRLNAGSLQLDIKWSSIKKIPFVLFATMMVAVLPAACYIYRLYGFPLHTIALSAINLELVFLLLATFYHKRKQVLLYKRIENSLTDELNDYKKITSEAIQDTEQRIDSLENIMEITKKIINEKDVAILFDNIRKLTAKALNSDRATVFIHDSNTHELVSGPELSEEAQEFRIEETRGIAGEIFKVKKIVNVRDAYNNPNFNKAVDRKTGYVTKNILGAPLVDAGNNFVGVIQVLNKQEGEFEKIDEQILETLSVFIASALKDSLVLRNLRQQLIDPRIEKGLSLLFSQLSKSYKPIAELLETGGHSAPQTESDNEFIKNLLYKMNILFNREYTITPTDIQFSNIRSMLNNFISDFAGDKDITFNIKSSILEDKPYNSDNELLNTILQQVVQNSIESIPEKGSITLNVCYHAQVPTYLIHEFSILDIVNDFNACNEKNSQGFIDYLKSRKPLLKNDLTYISDQLKTYIAFEIRDTGPRISKDIHGKIFKPFFSTKNQVGLGLAVSQAAAKLLGGHIKEPVNTKDGKTVVILLPVAPSGKQQD